MKVYD
jgi:hypothetical protein